MRIHVVYDTSETFLNLENVFFIFTFFVSLYSANVF